MSRTFRRTSPSPKKSDLKHYYSWGEGNPKHRSLRRGKVNSTHRISEKRIIETELNLDTDPNNHLI